MSSEVENRELKGKENNTDKLNLSGQTARQPISHDFFNHLQTPGQKSRTNSSCPCFYFNSIILSFLRSYTTLMQLSTVTRQEVE